MTELGLSDFLDGFQINDLYNFLSEDSKKPVRFAEFSEAAIQLHARLLDDPEKLALVGKTSRRGSLSGELNDSERMKNEICAELDRLRSEVLEAFTGGAKAPKTASKGDKTPLIDIGNSEPDSPVGRRHHTLLQPFENIPDFEEKLIKETEREKLLDPQVIDTLVEIFALSKDALVSKAELAEARLFAAEKRASAAEASAASLRAELSDALRAEAVQAEAAVIAEAKIAELRSQLRSAESATSSAEARLSATEARLRAAEEQASTARRRAAEAEDSLREASTDRERLSQLVLIERQSSLQFSEQALLEREALESESEEKTRTALRDAAATVAAAEAAAEAAATSQRALEEENRKLTEEIERLQASLTRQAREFDERLNEEIRRMENRFNRDSNMGKEPLQVAENDLGGIEDELMPLASPRRSHISVSEKMENRPQPNLFKLSFNWNKNDESKSAALENHSSAPQKPDEPHSQKPDEKETAPPQRRDSREAPPAVADSPAASLSISLRIEMVEEPIRPPELFLEPILLCFPKQKRISLLTVKGKILFILDYRTPSKVIAQIGLNRICQIIQSPNLPGIFTISYLTNTRSLTSLSFEILSVKKFFRQLQTLSLEVLLLQSVSNLEENTHFRHSALPSIRGAVHSGLVEVLPNSILSDWTPTYFILLGDCLIAQKIPEIFNYSEHREYSDRVSIFPLESFNLFENSDRKEIKRKNVLRLKLDGLENEIIFNCFSEDSKAEWIQAFSL